MIRCSSLLAYMMLTIKVPAVVRLAAKNAKYFFKHVDLTNLVYFKQVAEAAKDVQESKKE